MNIKESMRLYLVTDSAWSTQESFLSHIEEALKGGITCLQLREKNMSFEAFVKRAKAVKALCRKYKVPFLINDNIDVAKEVDADGVHIGQGDTTVEVARRRLGRDKIIGVTCKTVDQALEAEKAGADYIGSGAVFGSTTKTDTNRLDHRILREICQTTSIPVVAIGGVNEENILRLHRTGVDGVAVVSSILARPDKKLASENLYRLSGKIIENRMPKVLTIAGSDSSGGAGIQADLKTIAAHGCYGMSVITALTAQNTLGVQAVETCTPDFVRSQMQSVFTDIVPDAVKIGMLSTKAVVETIASELENLKSENQNAVQIVLDPVMISTSGSKLLEDDAIDVLKERLLPLARVITPNLSEAQLLSGLTIKTTEDMVKAARVISENFGGDILIKGGHLDTHANDLLYTQGKILWYEGDKIDNPNTHGTGCTLSSAIASHLAMGYDLPESIGKSKAYLTGAICDQLDLGQGRGPLNHMYKGVL